ncbi:unnamed protein product [Moneuplotes crassus]|uniref:Proteasome assembly chaperone 1 n=1 Tax=Euplotes crassus TaxID=5936 RepID=A0AAD2D3D5_EUPCR|nr:unnamed protein product [Moneuplotes crassus]
MAKYVPDELETKLEQDARKKFNFEIQPVWEEGKAYEETKTESLIHATFGNASAFFEILTEGEVDHVVDYVKVKQPDEEEEKKETKSKEDVLVKVYKSTKADSFFIIPEDDISDKYAKVISRIILSWLKPARIFLFDSMYKTAYASFDYIGDANILKFAKTSTVTDDLSKHGAEPIEVTNGISGLNGSLLTHSEIHRIPCLYLVSIIDSYEYTLETFGSYKGALSLVPAVKSHISKISDLAKRSSYKPTLKKYNQKKHNIYN